MFGNTTLSGAPFSATGGVSDSVVVTLASLLIAAATPSVEVDAKARVVTSGTSASSYVNSLTIVADSNLSLTGVSATSDVDIVDVKAYAVVAPSAVTLTSYLNDVNARADSNVSVASLALLNAFTNDVEVDAKAVVVPSGVAALGYAGDVEVSGFAYLSLTTPAANLSVGTVNAKAEAVASIYGVSAVAITDDYLVIGDEVLVSADAVISSVGAGAVAYLGSVDIAADANLTVVSPSGATTYINAVNARASAVVPVSGSTSVFSISEVEVDAQAVVGLSGVALTGYTNVTSVDTVKFDYAALSESYDHRRTLILNAQVGSETVILPPRETGYTVVLNPQDRNTKAIAA